MKRTSGSDKISRAVLPISGFLFIVLMAGVIHGALSSRQQPIMMSLTSPSAVAVDALGKVYVVESVTNQIHVFSAAGEHLRSYAKLNRPTSVAVDAAGRIIIANAGRGNVEVYNNDFSLLLKLGAGNGEFSAPTSVAADQWGDIYVADSRNDRIKVYNSDGSFKFSFEASGSQEGKFHFPTSLAVDNEAKELYVTDLPQVQTREGMAETARIQVFTLQGFFKRSFGTYGQGDGMLTRPMGVAVNGAGRVFVTDSYQNVVLVFDRNGSLLMTLFDLEHPMRNPLGIAVNDAVNDKGSVYISSLNTGKVEVYLVTE